MKKFLLVAITSIALMSCEKTDILPVSAQTTTTTQPCNGKRTVSVQCVGTTQAGSRCKNLTLSCNSKCHLHGGN
jgi:hypothetical protein